ncbi:MAG: response regulator transcription factor [Bacteroidia bacterium]|nr:response regulator transcription factor [Bacteroidia bacterium]
MKKIHIVIFDDNFERRESLTFLLETYEDFQVAGSYEDCRNVIKVLEETRPDVILMDIEMPEVNGIEAVKLIREKDKEVKIIMQTVFEDDEKVFDAMLAGASGYLLKKTNAEKIVEAIRDVMDGGSPMTPVVARKILERMREQQKPVSGEELLLSDREKEILQYLVQGLSYKMIADKCFISYHTVNSHIKKIYEKIQVHSQSEAVVKALKNKWVNPM